MLKLQLSNLQLIAGLSLACGHVSVPRAKREEGIVELGSYGRHLHMGHHCNFTVFLQIVHISFQYGTPNKLQKKSANLDEKHVIVDFT